MPASLNFDSLSSCQNRPCYQHDRFEPHESRRRSIKSPSRDNGAAVELSSAFLLVISSSMQLRCAAVPVTRHGVREKGPHVPAPISPRHRSVRRLAAARPKPVPGSAARADGPGVLIVSASRGAADDLARAVALARGGAIGLHRFSIAQLAARLAAPVLAARGIAPVVVHRGRSRRRARHVRSVQERRAGLLRPCRAHSRIPARARAHAARADARESRRGRARCAAARRCRPRAAARTLRGSVRGGVRNRSRRAVRGGSGGRRQPIASSRCCCSMCRWTRRSSSISPRS